MGVKLTLKSFLMPMSNKCLAKMSMNWPSKSSMVAFACWSSVEPVESKFEKNWSGDFWFAGRSDLTNSSNGSNSVMIRFCIVV